MAIKPDSSFRRTFRLADENRREAPGRSSQIAPREKVFGEKEEVFGINSLIEKVPEKTIFKIVDDAAGGSYVSAFP